MATWSALIEVAEAVKLCPSVLGAPLDARDAADLARGFTAMADPVRLRVLSMLATAPKGEVCACVFVGPLGRRCR